MDPISRQTDLVAETNHRVANSLTLLSGLVRMQAKEVSRSPKPFSNAEVRMMFDGVAARLSTVSQLHRMLAHMPADGVVPLGSHLREVSAGLIAAFSSEQHPIHIQHADMDCLVLAEHVQPLSLMLCEILTNAMKYAHPAGLPLRMALSCEAIADGILQVTVSDDGVGLPEGFDPARDGGIGFQIIRTLAAELGAALEVSSDSLGVTFCLRVPRALVANARTA